MKFTTYDPTTRSQHAEAGEDRSANRSGAPTIGDVIARRFARRDVLRGALGFTAIAAAIGPAALAASPARASGAFRFEEIRATVTETHEVAPGHRADVLLRWGDPLFPDAPAFDPGNQSAEAQRRQFGYNNDFVGFVPHPDAPDDPDRAVLVVNHEYTNEELMFPGLGRQDRDAAFADTTREMVDIEMAAHGGTVVEIRRDGDGRWTPVIDGALNRRITADTPMRVTGPAAGHAGLRTKADPTGTQVLGTINNCAGGITPWNTWLMAEENFNGYFWASDDRSTGEGLEDDPARIAFERYGIPGRWYSWGLHHERFDVEREPNEPNRFGWVVEVDPADSASTPRKRTALGRFKHEGAHAVLNGDGRVVVFMGDDQRFDYVYRFVSAEPFDRANPDPDILDRGTLAVARFEADGTVRWLPLVFGEGPLTAGNGFADQGDVLIHTRRAADFLEATPMDRPEDVEPDPERGTVYVMLTNNTRRKPGDENAANPRAENRFGHIVEIVAPEGDLAADEMGWEILVQCGDPAVAEVGATFSSATTRDGWFANPDNCAIDPEGRLWIATDGNSGADTGRADGLWALETQGEERATARHFFRCPAGAELCGPTFTPDGRALFLAVQHPGDDGEDWPEFGRTSTFDDPSTRWPDFEEGTPPRPSVVVVTRADGKRIG